MGDRGLGVRQNMLGQTHQTLPCPQYTQHAHTADHSKLITLTAHQNIYTTHTHTHTHTHTRYSYYKVPAFMQLCDAEEVD